MVSRLCTRSTRERRLEPPSQASQRVHGENRQERWRSTWQTKSARRFRVLPKARRQTKASDLSKARLRKRPRYGRAGRTLPGAISAGLAGRQIVLAVPSRRTTNEKQSAYVC